MDMTMVDVTDIPAVNLHDEVVLLGSQAASPSAPMNFLRLLTLYRMNIVWHQQQSAAPVFERQLIMVLSPLMI